MATVEPWHSPAYELLIDIMKTNDKYKERIISDPKIMMGKPVVKGTRVTIEIILRHLGAEDSLEQVLEDYPHLAREDILAAQSFAADYLNGETIIAAE